MKTTISMMLLAGALSAAPVVFQASGTNAAGVQPTLNNFQAALGTLNANTPVTNAGGRREINWDAVPQARSSPNGLPGDFFNGNAAPRARGAVFSTPGTGFEVSANSGEGPVEFSNLDPSYTDLFAPFSVQKIFTPVGSNVMDVDFFMPVNQTTRAVTRGFGVVFSDVDEANTTSIEYFDILNNSLGKYYASTAVGNETFSFLGVLFDSAQIGRVRITTGNAALGLGVTETAGRDLVAMDDFIYGEPEAVPEPGTWMMLSAGVGILAVVRRRS